MTFCTSGLLDVYNRLLISYGKQGWWPAQTPLEMMLGAVLTQNTAWANVERALNSLGRGVTPQEIIDMSLGELADKVRPSGYFNQKAPRLRSLAKWVLERGALTGGLDKTPDDKLRYELLSINGVGRETADSILLYAFGRPVFVIDAYTRRLFSRLGFAVPKDYDEFASCFTKHLPKDFKLYNEYHALIVKHCKARCTKNNPLCPSCPLKLICSYPA